MRSRSVTTFAVLLLGSIAVRSAAAQSAGDVVTATAAVDLKVEDAAVAAMSVGDALTVRKVQGKWLWVETAGGVRGWIDRKHITPAAPPRSPPERNETPVGEDDPWLVAIGVLAAQNVYTTYAYVGSVADGYARDTYTAEQVQNLTAEVVRMADVSIEHLEAVGETEIVDTDKKAIEGIVEILKLLKQEAAALSTFSRTQAQADLDEYEGVRTTVWPKIRAMLGLE